MAVKLGIFCKRGLILPWIIEWLAEGPALIAESTVIPLVVSSIFLKCAQEYSVTEAPESGRGCVCMLCLFLSTYKIRVQKLPATDLASTHLNVSRGLLKGRELSSEHCHSGGKRDLYTLFY